MEEISILRMFADYLPTEEMRNALAGAIIDNADLDPEKGSAVVYAHGARYIPMRLLERASREIGMLYGLRRLEFHVTHPAGELNRCEPEELMGYFMELDSMTRASLAGAKWEWGENRLTVRLPANGRDALEKLAPKVRQRLKDRFGADPEIIFEAGSELQGKALFDALESIREKEMVSLPAKMARQEQSRPQTVADADTIYGKPFRGTVIPMEKLTLDMGTVIVEGRVFAVEHKELTKRNAWVVKFDMTDNTGSIRISRFMEAKEAKPILDAVQVGSVLRIQGKLNEDRFENEMVLRPFAIQPGSMPKRRDTAEGEKRVELHLHTTMSNMDALTETAAAVKQAAAWGHKAIAITDHGVAQSFPDAMKAAAKAKVAGTDQNIKILYGCEGYYVNDVDDRPELVTRERFPTADAVVCCDLDHLADAVPVGGEDYVVVMTNGHSHDFAVQEQVLRGQYAYIGVIGSRAKTASVNARLRAAGIREEAIAAVHTPIGTAIKAVTPEEIAVSIAGEMICVRATRREKAGVQLHGCPMH